jgi:hypothetical protein
LDLFQQHGLFINSHQIIRKCYGLSCISYSEKMPDVNEDNCESKPTGKSCPGGSWCCLNKEATASVCSPCPRTIFGHCLSLPKATCDNAGLEVWNDISRNKVISAARDFTENLINKAAASTNSDPRPTGVDETACTAAVFGKDCPQGEWCCLNDKKSQCVPCTATVGGYCSPFSDGGDMVKVCEKVGFEPWNDASAAVAKAKEAAAKAAQAAMTA